MPIRDHVRPPSFSFGEGLGLALQNAGSAFAALGVEKKKAAALEAARAQKIADRDEERAYREGLTEEQRAYEEGLAEEKRALELADRDEQREYDEEKAVAEAVAKEKLQDEEVSYRESVIIDNEVRIVGYNKDGDQVKDFGPDPDYRTNDDGNIVRLSAGGKGATETSLKESEMKFRVHARSLQAGRTELERVLGEGFDLRSPEAALNRAAANIPFGNFFQTEQGQRVTVAARRIAEALFKGESGAAGSDQEAARYRSFIPQEGDHPSVVAMKFRILDETQRAFAEAGKLNMGIDGAVMYARKVAEVAAFEQGFRATDMGFTPPAASRFTIVEVTE